jgi:hypothetical protein
VALRDWQLALGQLVEARSAGREPASPRDVLAGLELDEGERAWLEDVAGTRGFALTSFVPRWWRETRVRRSAQLTFAALGEQALARLHDYQRAVPTFTLFFVPEGIAFIDYINTLTVPALVHAVARFERAMWNVRWEPPMSAPISPAPEDGPLVRHPAAALIPFEAPPELILAALLQGEPLPDPTAEPHYVLVAPGLPSMWRPATSDEARAFQACEPASTARALRSLPGGSPEIVERLRAARALIAPALDPQPRTGGR